MTSIPAAQPPRSSSTIDEGIALARVSAIYRLAPQPQAGAVVFSLVVSLVLLKLVDLLVGLRVTEHEERIGLDLTQHKEAAYTMID